MKGTRIMRCAAIVLAAVMMFSLTGIVSMAYIDRGSVSISGKSAYELSVGENASLTVSPHGEAHLPGCGMADCPEICGEKECIVTINGQKECTCNGTDLTTYYADVEVSSSDTGVAEVSYNGKTGEVTITAKKAGTASVSIDALFREYRAASKTVAVTVTEKDDPAPSPGDPDDDNSGTDPVKPDDGTADDPSGPSDPDTPTVTENAAAAQSYRVRTYNTNRTEDGQTVEVVLTFDKEVDVLEGAENDLQVKIAGSSLDQAPNTENGVSNRTLSVKKSDTDAHDVVITIGSKAGSSFVKQTNAQIEIQASSAGVTHILTADNRKPVNVKYLKSIIPSGLELTTSSETAFSGTNASVSKKVTHRANVRTMVYVQPMLNGEPILPADLFDNQSYVIHAHAFIATASGDAITPELTESDYAKLISDGFGNAVKKDPSLAARFSMTHNGDTVTLTDSQAAAGETLDVVLYEWPSAGEMREEPPQEDSDEAFFSDVTGWEKEYVYYLAKRGILKGYSDNIFAPLDNVTRAEFSKILAAASGETIPAVSAAPFGDVASDSWYAPYVAWAKEKGFVSGTGGGLFSPDSNITRQDMAVMIARYADSLSAEIPSMEAPIQFGDRASIASYAVDAVQKLQEAGIISGDVNGNFYPPSNATRAQAAKMIAVFLQVTAK